MTLSRPLREPERNEPCLCGSGRKFKKCCGPKYRDLPHESSWQDAYARGHFQEALALLRPEFCRYAIWHRTNTVPWYERDPSSAELLLSIDILALGDYLDRLQDCYSAAGIRDEFPAVLERVRSLVDDPRWGHQLVLQKALWALGREWDRERGKEALEGLAIDEVTDAEILTVFLDVHDDDLSVPEKLQLCHRIIELSDDASYVLNYSALKGLLWIFLGETETGVSMLESALKETRGAAELDTGWGQQALIRTLHIVGVHREDKELLTQARAVCEEALRSDSWKDSGRALLHQSLGGIAIGLGDYEEAIRHFLGSLDLHETAPVQISLGRAYLATRKVEQASSTFASIAVAELDGSEYVDFVLARYGLLLLPHEETLRDEIRSELEALEPRFPIHREVRDEFLRHINDLAAKDSGLLERLRSVWRNLGAYVVLQPNIFGIGVDLKSMVDKVLGAPSTHQELLAVPSDETGDPNGETA